MILGLTAAMGSVRLISNTFSVETGQALLAAREMIAREFNEQVELLSLYSEMLRSSRNVLAGKNFPNGSIESIEVGEAQLAVRVITADNPDVKADPPLLQLLTLAHRSDKAQIRVLDDREQVPTIALVRPIAGEPDRFLLLTSKMDKNFLSKIVTPLKVNAQILSLDKRILISTDAQAAMLPELSADELHSVLSGGLIYKTLAAAAETRFLFCAIPLASTDLILLSISRPMANLKTAIRTLTTQSAIIILVALLIGGIIFFKLLCRVMRPLGKFLTATEIVSAGNLDFQTDIDSKDEFGILARSFNAMVSEIGTLYNQRIIQEKSLAGVKEELKYKELLEAKNREIERTNQELRTHLEEMSALFNLNQAMASSLELEVLFDRMIEVLKDLLHCNLIVLSTYNPVNEELVVRKSFGINQEDLQGMVFQLDEGITGKVAMSRETIYIQDVSADGRNLNYKGCSKSEGSLISVPLVIKDRLAGVLNLHKHQTDAFTPGDLKLVQAIANQAAVAIDNSQLYEQARNLSNTDELTGLANRRHFQTILQRELAQSQRFHTRFTLIMADLDNFKAINDTHGHLKGDLLLNQVGQILLQNTRGIDLVARYGGEEFVVLLPKTDTEGARAAAEKLRISVMTEKYHGIEQSHPGGYLTVSLGIAEYPSDSRDVYELLELADRALYRAKNLGKNRVIAWNDVLDDVRQAAD
jgi:diguanylate cyclase (GGDEF)-like protein